MLTTQIETEYFIWYNPITCKYESGDIAKYEADSEYGTTDKFFPLILKFDENSHHIADRVIKELNTAKNQLD